MGVHDYTCSVCREPMTYICNEGKKTKKGSVECDADGFGSDEVWVDLLFFPTDAAPETAEELEAYRDRAVNVIEEKRGYDWGAWEFVPSLNYRTLLMDDRDATGVWRLKPFEDYHDGSPIELEIPVGQTVWAVNYCLNCRAQFVDRSTTESPCRLYLEQIGKFLRIPLGDNKDAFVAQVQERVDRRRPARRS